MALAGKVPLSATVSGSPERPNINAKTGSATDAMNNFHFVEKFGCYWEVFCGSTFAAGPFGSLKEALTWAEAHSPKEFQTQSYHKNCLKGSASEVSFEKIATEILNRQPNLFNKLKNLG